MTDETILNRIDRIADRMQYLKDKLLSSDHTSMDVMFELVTARALLADVSDQLSTDPRVPDLIREIDRLLELHGQSTNDDSSE
ncbi:MAG: hypothetical protein J7J98_01160 [candidate division Zixibacteria bacterium]|nr:hypothetical protein [candidate division Zixibacteria bacterium]